MIGHIPRELQTLKRWVCWKAEEGKNGRVLKVPYNARTGRKAKVNDKGSWSTFPDALTAYDNGRGGYAGLGFVFTGGRYVGIDLDGCAEDGEITQEALSIVRRVDSYTEFSPSGRGLHIIVKGKLPGGRSSLIRKCSRGMKQIEIYGDSRFFTVTGESLPGFDEIRAAGKAFFGLCAKIEALNEKPGAAADDEDARFDDAIFLKNVILPALPCEKVSYNEWLEIGMVCRLVGLSCEDWDAWSATDATRYHEEECESKWRGFSDKGAGRSVDMGTAVTIAKKYGWKPETGSAGTPKKTGATLEARSMRDLMEKDLPPVKWAVVGMIPQGLTLLCSPPKYGKSWMCLDLCFSVAAGRPFLGHETVKAGALYLALEDSENRLQERLRKVAAGDPVPVGFQYATNAETLDNGLIDQLSDHLQKNPGCGLIVVDTLQKISGDKKTNESAYAYDYRRMSALKHFADVQKVSVVVVHHLRKGNLNNYDPFERISGTSGLFGAADASIVMQREKRDDVLTEFHITGRDVSPESYLIEFDKTSFQWIFKGETEAARYEDDPIVQTVRHLLEESEEWKGTATELWEACEAFTGKPIDEEIRVFGKHIRDIAPKMYERDDISYFPPGKNGGVKGRQHTFRKEETIF